jgi:ribosome maturation factor RimP
MSAARGASSAGQRASAVPPGLRELVESVVSRAGYDLEGLTVVEAGRRRLLRVVVDSDTGVELDEAARVSRDISAALDGLEDSADPMGASAYTLEVTSPGIGRPLTEARHFRRARGRLLSVTLTDGSLLRGRIRQADDAGVDLLVGRSGTERRRLEYQAISKATVDVEFNPPRADVLALLDEDTAARFELTAPPELTDPHTDQERSGGTDDMSDHQAEAEAAPDAEFKDDEDAEHDER